MCQYACCLEVIAGLYRMALEGCCSSSDCKTLVQDVSILHYWVRLPLQPRQKAFRLRFAHCSHHLGDLPNAAPEWQVESLECDKKPAAACPLEGLVGQISHIVGIPGSAHPSLFHETAIPLLFIKNAFRSPPGLRNRISSPGEFTFTLPKPISL